VQFGRRTEASAQARLLRPDNPDRDMRIGTDTSASGYQRCLNGTRPCLGKRITISALLAIGPRECRDGTHAQRGIMDGMYTDTGAYRQQMDSVRKNRRVSNS